MKKHRIFVAINLPENIKGKLLSYKEKWPELPVKWTKKENLHITLFFLGNIFEKELMNVLKETQEFALKTSPFIVKLDKISYFPNKQRAKYIFATGGKYHITLGRIKPWEFRRIEEEDVPEISEDINLDFGVDSIEVMESFLKRSGPEYATLQSYKLINFSSLVIRN